MCPSLSNIALVGATGTLGSNIFSNLLTTFPTVTVISRPDSDLSKLPKNDKIVVKRVAADDHAGRVEALKGVDALVITQNMMAPPEVQLALCDAAVEAGVKWVLPNEYGSDNQHAALSAAVPIMAAKHAPAKRIAAKAAELGKPTKFIRVVSNPWYDFSIQAGAFGITAPTKTATLYDAGTQPTYTTTLPAVGLAVARLLALPETELAQYANGYVYVHSFKVSQRDILASVQRVTGTTDADWTVESVDRVKAVKEAQEAFGRGEFRFDLIYGQAFAPDMGGLYEGRELANEKLGLPELDLDTETRKALGL